MIGTISEIEYGIGAFYFEDKTPMNGTNYYRLRWIDETGKNNFSTIALIHSSAFSNDVMIYPNPLKNVLRLQVPHTIEGKIEFEILNVRGGVVQRLEMMSSSNPFLSIPIHNLPVGLYHLKLKDMNSRVYFGRFIKL